jgi:hypothetical protein
VPLDDKKIGRQIIVEQRTHANDLTGHVLAESDWYRIALPAIAERKTIIVFPRSQTERVREEGDILWPAREGPAELEAAKLRMGALGFSAQYQQAPTAPGGNLFKGEWLRQSYRTIPRLFDGGIVLSLDTAYKTSTTNDFSAAVVVGHLKHPDGEHAPGFYLLWAWQSRCEFPRPSEDDRQPRRAMGRQRDVDRRCSLGAEPDSEPPARDEPGGDTGQSR